MLYGKLKDVVRAGIGLDDLNPDLLDYYLATGRREIEQKGNFYWMQTRSTFALTDADSSYVISATPISLSNFKDIEMLAYKDPDDVQYSEIPWASRPVIDRRFSTTEEGPPVVYTIDASDNLIIAPIPDDEYDMLMLAYTWTSNPASNLSEDELCKRFPEVLINAAVATGLEILTKSQELAAPWRAKFKEGIREIRHHDNYRRQLDQIALFPARGGAVKRPYAQWGW